MTENTSETEREIVNAFRGKDWDKCIKLIEITRDEAVIEERKSELVKSQQELAKRKEVLTGKVPAPAGFNPRRFRLHVPYGAIDHSYLLVTSALRDGLSSSEKLIIDIPATGETITTTVYLRNKHLAERRAIRRFYQAAGVQRNDRVLLEETAPGRWRLTKPPSVQQAPPDAGSVIPSR